MTRTSPSLQLIDPSDKLLNLVADNVQKDEIASAYIQDIIDRMYQIASGKGHHKKDTRQMVGLAAPQLGVSKRIVLIDITASGANQPQNLQVYINPTIISRSDAIMPGREGCWSTGTICGIVERAKEVVVEALDRDGSPVSVTLSGFTARIAQHELDHLDGIRFPDRIPADKPERLHQVAAVEFEDYRQKWATWPNLYPRQRWVIIKNGDS